MKNSCRKLLWAILWLQVVGVLAQDIRLGLSDPPYYKGCPLTFQIVLQNKEAEEPPQMGETPDFAVEALAPQSSTSSQISIINGRRSENRTVTTAYAFRLTPKRTGQLQIPQCTLKVEGTTRKTRPHTIRVEALDSNATVQLECVPDKTVCAVGEPVVFRFTWSARANIRNYELTLPLLAVDHLDAEPVALTEREQNQRGAMMLQTTSGAKIQALQRANPQQITISFGVTVVPRKAGEYVLAPAQIVCDIVDTSSPRRQSRRRGGFPFDDDFFDNPFFGPQYNTKKCAAETAGVTLTVKEPPTEGRPVSYTGLAEACTLSCTADRTDVYAGDPIVLSITLKGPRFPQAVRLPKLSSLPGFSEQFRVFDNDAPGQLNDDGSVTFQRTIRAATTEATAIPPVEIAWFDAGTGEYRSTRTEPIPIQVKATKRAAAVSSEPVAAVTGERKIDVTASTQALRENFAPAECVVNQQRVQGPGGAGPDVWLLVGFPLLTALLAGGQALIRHRHQHADAYRARGAAKAALAVLGKATPETAYQAVLEALNGYLAAKTQRHPETITLQDGEGYLAVHGAAESLQSAFCRLYNDCEAALYAGAKNRSSEDVLTAARGIIKELEGLK